MSLSKSLMQGMRRHRGEPVRRDDEPVRRRRPPREDIADVTAEPRMSDAHVDKPDFVSSVVRAVDSRPEESRETSESVHVSSLIGDGWCLRRAVLAKRYGIRPKHYAGTQNRIIWAMGRAAEHHLRNSFIEGHGRTGVVGDWRCSCGETHVRGAGLSDNVAANMRCGHCGTPPVIYGELVLHGRDGAVTGSPDLLYTLNRTMDALHVTEIKSMNKEQFAALTAPLGPHVQQVTAYAQLLVELGRRVASYRVVYVAKAALGPKVSPFKEFIIGTGYSLDQPDTAALMLVNAGEEASVWLKDTTPGLPSRHGACSRVTSTKAKTCAACTLCFQMD